MLRHAPLIFAIVMALPLAAQKPTSSVRRHAANDLEVITFDANGKQNSSRFLSRTYLATLPQISFPLTPDENFPELSTNVRVTGVDLNLLLGSIAPADPSAALVAICRDGYTSAFPRPAILDHHPILVLTIDGLTPHAWSLKNHAYDPGPYFITYANFVASYQVLVHADFPQHPAEILRLKVPASSQLFAAITPPNAATLPSDSPVITGFRIAQQNCFRCHNSGDTGGTKARRTWQHLAEVAKSRPDYFAAWVHNPHSIDPNAKMTPNLQYDQSTLNALTRYFQTFSP